MNTQPRRSTFSNLGLALIFLAAAFALAVPATHAAPPATGDWTLVWSDEFDCGSTKEAPNPANWGYENGYVRNSEDQQYTNNLKNAYCQNGLMNIEAHKEKDGTITSASLVSHGKVSYKYGWMEMRGRIDTRLGSWPAFWSLGTVGDWPDSGESDIMEYYQGKLLFNAAWQKTGDGTWDARWDSVAVNLSSLPSGWEDEFHVWAMEWTPDYVKYYMDGVLYNTWDSSQDNNGGGDSSVEGFQHPHYLLLNQAIGGTAGGDASGLAYPTTYEIDYVRWYQNDNPETLVDDTDASIIYSGTWGTYVGSGGHLDTEHYSETAWSTATFSFNGTQAWYYGFKRNDLGKVNIYVDDIYIETLDLYSSTFQANYPLFDTGALAPGLHTLKVELTDTKNPSSSGYEANIDAFSWIDTGDTPPPPPPTSDANSTTTVAYAPSGAVGQSIQLLVKAKDANGVPLSEGGDSITANVTGANSAVLTFVDNNDGTYVATYTPSLIGTNSVSISLNGTELAMSPLTSQITQGFQLKVMSFNVKRSDLYEWDSWRLAETINAIKEADADIVGTQEMMSEADLQDVADGVGFGYIDYSSRIASRYPIVDVSPGYGARIEVLPEQYVWVYNTHWGLYAPWDEYYLPYTALSGNYTEAEVIDRARHNWDERSGMTLTLSHITSDMAPAFASGDPVFLVGDFNEPSHLDWTQAAADAGVVPMKVNAPLSNEMLNLGFTDSFRAMRPDEINDKAHTWATEYDTIYDRIDLIYFKGAGVSVTDSQVLGENSLMAEYIIAPWPSDHRAVVSTFVLPGEGVAPAQPIMAWVASYANDVSKAAVQADLGACGPKDGLTRIGLQFWKVENNGTITYDSGVQDSDVAWWTDFGASNNIKILLTVHNSDGGWNWDLARSAFANNRTALVNSLVTELERLNLDGVDIDFEGVGDYESDRSAFSQFITELSVALKSRGKLLTIDSFPYIWNAPNINWYSDWAGKVDNIHSMGYDDLYEGSTTDDWRKYSYQQSTGITAGYSANSVLMGMPDWVDNWGGSTGYGTDALAHIKEIRNDLPAGPSGIAIWDLQLRSESMKSSDTWCEIADLKTAISSGGGDGGDTTAPTPNPMSWTQTPYMNQSWPEDNVATMTATTASDPSGGIEYYFECTEAAQGCEDSGWQAESTFSDWYLISDNTFHYRVKARDSIGNETGWSAEAAITVGSGGGSTDTTSWALVPYLNSNWLPQYNVASMTATSTLSGTVEYYFDCIEDLNGCEDRGWAANDSFDDWYMEEGYIYHYRVKSRNATDNETEWSAEVAFSFGTVNTPPTSNFGFTTSNLTANYTDGSSDSDGTISSWSWNFGDGSTSTSQNPSYTYAAAGTYTVNLTVTDNDGATDNISKSVTVTAAPVPDTEAPSITAPEDVTKEATGVTTAVDLGTPTVSDTVDPSPTVTNDAPAAFPVGATTVTWMATDAIGNSATATHTVTVIETTAPSITAPGDVSVESSIPIAVALGMPTVSDLVDPNPTVTNNAPDLFSLGTTTVTWTVTDGSGNSATATQIVTVSAPQPPAAPTDLTSTVNQSGKGKNKVVTGISLNWTDNSNNETGFVIEGCTQMTTGQGKNRTVTCTYGVVGTVGVDVTSLTLDPATENDHFRVKAVNVIGSSAWSNELKI